MVRGEGTFNMIRQQHWKQSAFFVALLLTLSLFFLASAHDTFPGDNWGLLRLQTLETGWLNTAMLAVTTLGRFAVAGALIAVTTALLWISHRRRDAALVAFSSIPLLAGHALKLLIDRPRPDHLLAGYMPMNPSFPSGHAFFAALFGGLLIIICEDLVRSVLPRRLIQAGLTILVLAVGASRVYLGVHWPSDIIGGYLFGAMALLGLVRLREWLPS